MLNNDKSTQCNLLLYKCAEVKSKDFKSQEKRKVGNFVHAVGGGGGAGAGGGGSAERKKERKKEKGRADNNYLGKNRDKEK
jgi:hypothetical protein